MKIRLFLLVNQKNKHCSIFQVSEKITGYRNEEMDAVMNQTRNQMSEPRNDHPEQGPCHDNNNVEFSKTNDSTEHSEVKI